MGLRKRRTGRASDGHDYGGLEALRIAKTRAPPSLEDEDECDIFEALRTKYDPLASRKERPANTEQKDFIKPVDTRSGTSRQKQKTKASLGQQWDSGRTLTRPRTGSKPAIFIVGDKSEEGTNTGTHLCVQSPIIHIETEHSPFFTPTDIPPYNQHPTDTLSFITSHPSIGEASQPSSHDSQAPLVRPRSALQLAPTHNLDAFPRPSLLKTSWSSRSLLEKMGIRGKENPVLGAEGDDVVQAEDSPSKLKGVMSLVAVFEKLKK